MLQNALYSTQCLDHVCTIVVEVPQLPVMTLVRPPEWILLQDLQQDKERRIHRILEHLVPKLIIVFMECGVIFGEQELRSAFGAKYRQGSATLTRHT